MFAQNATSFEMSLTRRMIAKHLAYSVKAIEAYLSRIYAKTGCRNRVDLAPRFTAAPA